MVTIMAALDRLAARQEQRVKEAVDGRGPLRVLPQRAKAGAARPRRTATTAERRQSVPTG